MSSAPDFLILGEILRPHGVRGELRIRILTEYPERISQLEKVYIGRDANKTAAKIYNIEQMRLHQEGYGLLRITGVNDRDAADRLRDHLIMVALEDAVPLEDDEFYLYQVIGLKVQTDDGKLLGTISDVLETGANDVYIIDSPQYGEILIPVTDETILETDIDNGVVTVKLLDGLLPDA
jgi:16S rRNA processing protein RimM